MTGEEARLAWLFGAALRAVAKAGDGPLKPCGSKERPHMILKEAFGQPGKHQCLRCEKQVWVLEDGEGWE